MSTDSRLLDEEHQQLLEVIELYPAISLLETQGQPVNSYRIAYELRGYTKNERGHVQVGSRHAIRINLPDGYPQTAPVVFPLTPIFHPDAAPDRLRIDAHWRSAPSLAELVLHIGEMLCGVRYSRTEPLDPEAAQWYREHDKELPLDILTIATIEELTDRPGQNHVDNALASLGLEMVELDQEMPEVDQETRGEPEWQSTEQQLDELRRLVDDHAMFAARGLIHNLQSANSLPASMQPLVGQVERALAKAEQLHQLALQLTDMGQYEEGFEVIDILADTVSDAPELATLRTHIRNVSQRALTEERLPEETAPPAPAETTPPVEAPLTSDREVTRSSSFSPRISPRSAILFGIVALTLAGGGAFAYFKEQRTINQVQAMRDQGRDLIDQLEFQRAQSLLQTAHQDLNSLFLLRSRKGDLAAALDQLLTSRELQDGMQGKALHKGEYITTAQAKALRQIAQLSDQGQASLTQNKTAEALALYRQALQLAVIHQCAKERLTLQETVQTLEFQQNLTLAEQAERDKDWQKATDAYRKVLSLSGESKETGNTAAITRRLTAATFRHDLDQSKKAFLQSQWQETIRLLKQAQSAIAANPNAITEQERRDLGMLLLNAQLSQILSEARAAYQIKNWELAISEYQKALSLLAEAPEVKTMAAESVAQIEQTLLMIQVTQLQEQMQAAAREGKNATVLDRGREMQRLLRTSRDQNNPEIAGLLAHVTAQVNELDVQMRQEKQEQWLMQNFQHIFRANYPTYKGSTLSEPRVRLLSKENGKAVYSLSCIEFSQGKSSRIELRYQFDPATNKWGIFQK